MKLKKPLITCVFVSGIVASQEHAALREFHVPITMLDSHLGGLIDLKSAKDFIENLNDKFIEESGKKLFTLRRTKKFYFFENKDSLVLI